MPKSGKTTVLDAIAHYLRRRGLLVHEFHGGGRYAPIDKSALPQLNLYLAASVVQELAAIGFPRGSEPGVYLLDRGPLDRILFSRALCSVGRLTSEHVDAVTRILTSPELRRRVDLTLLFVTDPTLSLARETANRLTEKDGRVMNTGMLEALRAAAASVDDVARDTTKLLDVIDTAELDGRVRLTAERVLARICRIDGLEWLAPT